MQYILNSDEAWQSMAEACSKAKHSIFIEQYVFHNDRLGSAFLNLLVEKAKEGVQVHLLLDAFGSRNIQKSLFFSDLLYAGGKVVFYRPLRWWNVFFPLIWFPRTHCKTLHIDEHISYLGSNCIAECMHGWREIFAQLSAPLAMQAREDFAWIWQYAQGQFTAPPPCHSQDSVYYACQRPEIHEYAIYHALLKRIEQATVSVYLATPYFFPPRRLRFRLRRAVRRGVKVTLLLSERTDVYLSDIAAYAMIEKWRKLGIHVCYYQGHMLHAKYAIIDDEWATFGSSNFDYLSLRCNREANIVLHGPEVQTLLEHWEHDSRQCIPATIAQWDKLSWWEKALGKLCSAAVQVI